MVAGQSISAASERLNGTVLTRIAPSIDSDRSPRLSAREALVTTRVVSALSSMGTAAGTGAPIEADWIKTPS